VAVKRAIDAGRITTVDQDGRRMIDPEVADIQWAKNTRAQFRPLSSYKADPAQGDASLAPAHVPSAAAHPVPPEAIGYRGSAPAPAVSSGESLPAVLSIYDVQAARAKREYHEANLAAMREAKEAGALVDRDRVVKLATDAGAAARASLERLPGLSLELAALSDPLAIQALLAAKINEALADLIDNLRRMAGQDHEDADGNP